MAHFISHDNPRSYPIRFYIHCLMNNLPIKGQLKIIKQHVMIEEFVSTCLISNQDNFKHDTLKLLKHLHELFGVVLIQVINELNQSDKYYTYGELSWYCFTLYGIKPNCQRLLENLNIYSLSIDLFDQILKYVYETNAELLYYPYLMMRDSRYLNVLKKYIDVNKMMQVCLDQFYKVNLTIIRVLFYQMTYQMAATLCCNINRDVYDQYCDQMDYNRLCHDYKKLHERQRKLDLLTKWIRIKFVSMKIYYYVQTHLMTKPDAIRRAAEHSYKLSYG